MKIKIIDLLNKISNGEKIPKKIKYKNKIWEYDEYSNDYKSEYTWLFGKLFDYKRTIEFINDEIEILDEPKKIEKLPYYSLEKIQKSKNKDEWYENRLELLEKRINDYHNKINELIDEINNLKENK